MTANHVYYITQRAGKAVRFNDLDLYSHVHNGLLQDPTLTNILLVNLATYHLM